MPEMPAGIVPVSAGWTVPCSHHAFFFFLLVSYDIYYNIEHEQEGARRNCQRYTIMSEAMTTAFETALTAVKTDVVSMVTTALPIGLAIMGLFLAIRLGINFFRLCSQGSG